MAALSPWTTAGEALALGLATGPVCLASCGPVVLPWMLMQPRGVRTHGQQLSIFLATRMAGYLLFATAAWLSGAAFPRGWTGRSWLLGGIQLLLAAALLFYAAGWRGLHSPHIHEGPDLVQIGASPKPAFTGAATLGFLTGINLCPPFLVAGVRAAEAPSLPDALFYFGVFFAGTSVWFAPFISLGWVKRTPALLTVARILAVLLACWYGMSGVSILLERAVYG